ncbi:phosphoethanolamine transferase [Fulvimonas yonginensis]|uniref:Sulfatase-like hydrolase/transferase n=1 Tax=Fulvimonas yonginensis TaxID=1495200 RepID=A0ABU8JDW5_9GAMM
MPGAAGCLDRFCRPSSDAVTTMIGMDHAWLTRRRVALASIAVLALLLMIPNVALVVASTHVKKPSWVAASLVAPAAMLLAYFAVLGRRPRLACLLMAPFAALVPTVALYILRYRSPVTEAVVGTVMATNPAEAADFLGPWLWVLVALSLAAGAFAIVAGRLGARAGLQLVSSRRVHTTLIALAAVPVIAFASLQVAASREPPAARLAGGDDVDSRSFRIAQDSYPFGIPLTLGVWWSDRVRAQAAIARTQRFRFHAYRAVHPDRRQIYVLVIGESSRSDHWQLFGYGRPTNPELSHTGHVIPVTDMVSPWPMSIGGVPALLTRRPPQLGLFQPFEEQSVVGLMREAGFDTWWLSNQSPSGDWNSPITVYAEEAQHLEWLTLQKYDSSLPERLAEIVRETHGDLFVVLHTIGSHGNYDSRYPDAFKHFVPTVQDGGPLATDYQRVTNSYDNTVRYTDHVLSQTTDVLERTDAVTAMWYQSDHGETLPTATCAMTEHGHGFRYEFPVPTLFWYSDAYAQAFPGKVATLRANANKRATSADTFATLADMAGVGFPSHDRSRSLFSPTWRYRPRIIHPVWQEGNAWVDYDHADLGNGCELVRGRAG